MDLQGGRHIPPEGCTTGVAFVFILIVKGGSTGAGKSMRAYLNFNFWYVAKRVVTADA